MYWGPVARGVTLYPPQTKGVICQFLSLKCVLVGPAETPPLTTSGAPRVFTCPVSTMKSMKRCGDLVGKASRSKGARGERMLRDELRRHGWEDVSREGWKQVKGGQEACDDVVGRPPGSRKSVAFENKFYATGFDKYYTLLGYFQGRVACEFPEGDAIFAALDPNTVLENVAHMPLAQFPTGHQKTLKSLVKKCRDWAGNAQILSLKQNGLPFLYCRYHK